MNKKKWTIYGAVAAAIVVAAAIASATAGATAGRCQVLPISLIPP